MITKNSRELAARIGQYYLAKNNGDYDKTRSDIELLKITEVLSVGSDIAVIKTGRPSMLIGKRGDNIDQLSAYLGKRIYIYENPECIEDYLIPQPKIEMENDLKFQELYDFDNELDERCQVCQVEGHDICSNDINCPCCMSGRFSHNFSK